MRLASALSASTLGWLLAVPVAAQQATLEPSAAVACMTPAADVRGVPAYPFDAYKQGGKGRVKVVLSFALPDSPPDVEVAEREGDNSFVDAVRAHVSQLRVPCHDGSQRPVRLDFEFVFRPDDREVFYSGPDDSDAAARKAQLACMQHERGPQSGPEYPAGAVHQEVAARVVARLRFEAPDKPPVAEVYSSASEKSSAVAQMTGRAFSIPVERWVQGYRMPCLQGRPITVNKIFVFRFEDTKNFGFKPDMALMDFLPAVRNIRLQRLNFDFNRMGCPFDVALTYFQPHLPNAVAEIGNRDPARRPFLDWLRQSALDLPDNQLASVFGDEARLTVPCLKINLQPQEPS